MSVEPCVATTENLELLVNNAGFGTRGLFFRADVRGQDQMRRLHVLATLRLTQPALELKDAGSAVKMQRCVPGTRVRNSMMRLGWLIADSLWMSAEEVVAVSLRGLERGKLVVVPGWRYRLLVLLMKHAPRWLLNPIAVRQQRRLGRRWTLMNAGKKSTVACRLS